MNADDFLKSLPKWTGNCPHCRAIINPAFNLHIGDPCPFCRKPLSKKNVGKKIQYGRSLF